MILDIGIISSYILMLNFFKIRFLILQYSHSQELFQECSTLSPRSFGSAGIFHSLGYRPPVPATFIPQSSQFQLVMVT